MLHVCDWWVLSQIKANVPNGTFFTFLDTWMTEELVKRGEHNFVGLGFGNGRSALIKTCKKKMQFKANAYSKMNSKIKA